MIHKLSLTIALLCACALLPACKKDDKPAADGEPANATKTKPDTTPDTKPDTTPDTKPPAQPLSAEAKAAAEAIMAKYEACRAKLAADDADVKACAEELAAAADAAKAALATSATAGAAAEAIAGAAKQLAAVDAADIEAVRLAFGEVSKPVEQLLIAAPQIAATYKMYECPMAKGFKRWAQPDMGDAHAMANPYMGKKMLECGSEVHDHHTGGGHGAAPSDGAHGKHDMHDMH